ncbi:MAG TPA: PfkB family carbohydrate kinase [Vicinamibacterales bacterium]|nr:PfkB family carbohydrate kinase [Vicinamibacterales bacterium]
MDSAQLLSLVGALGSRTVAVIGDVVADEFVYGRVARVSREAPVLILEYDSTEVVPGAGGNAANNVAALGGQAILVGVVGRDEPGRRLGAALHKRVHQRGLVRAAGRSTAVKTRILAGGIHSAKQQVVRIDRAVGDSFDRTARASFDRYALEAALEADAVLVSDYGSGLVTTGLVSKIRTALHREGRPIPVLIDSRYRLLDYRGLTACTPNESEVEQALGVRINDSLPLLERAGRAVLERTGMQAVLITRGGRGMALFVPKVPTVHIPIFGSDEIADVTGAGDTVMATMTLALASGATFEAAARLANYAGGLVVMKRGTATVSADELRSAIRSDAPGPPEGGPHGKKEGGPHAKRNVGAAFRRPTAKRRTRG